MKRISAFISVIILSIVFTIPVSALDFDSYRIDVSWENAPEGTAYLDILIPLSESDEEYTSFNAPPRRIEGGYLDKEGNPLKLTRNISLVEKDFTINVGDNLEGWRQGCRNTKWHVTRNDFANGRNQSNDIPLLRYADVLLMKAEALTRQGSSAEAKDLVNQIRKYAGAEQLTSNPTLDDIYQERAREFFDENWRRNDMIRFGHFEDEYFPHYKDYPTANFDKTRRIFPVHKNMLDLNPKWSQNAGY